MITTLIVGLIFLSLLGNEEAQNVLTYIALFGLPILLVMSYIF